MNSRQLEILPVVFFGVVLIGAGLYIGTLLPAASMFGMRSDVLLDLGRHASRYTGGVGISTILGGGGLLAGQLMRLIVLRVRTGKVPEKSGVPHGSVVCVACLALCFCFGMSPPGSHRGPYEADQVLRLLTVFFLPLSSSVTNPIGRLCGSGGVMSSRSASNTCFN